MDTRLPLPLSEVFKRIKLSGKHDTPVKCLDNVSIKSHIIQDYVSLSNSIEWELSQLHWSSNGLLPFVENNVPFIVNNSGKLSELCAIVLFRYCEETQPSKEIKLLELGAGIGLFARYFLDRFQQLCQQEGKDYYDRLLYYVTDYSRTTINQWNERNLFENHLDQVCIASCDGLKPELLTDREGNEIQLDNIDAVFCNYMLDILPSTVLKLSSDGVQELRIRTSLNTENPDIGQYTDLSCDSIAKLLKSDDKAERISLIPLIDVLEFETSFFDIEDDAITCLDVVKDFQTTENKILLNQGALTCLDQCTEMLSQDGFILINDYGPVKSDQALEFTPAQRFGSTVANGLNFPFLEFYYDNTEYHLIAPPESEKAPVQARMLAGKNINNTVSAFTDFFGAYALEYTEGSLVTAREHHAAGRKNEALSAYHSALSHNQNDWYVVGEIAEFLISQAQDYQSAIELVQHAITLNPYYSAWLWNILGDGLYCLQRIDEAHEAYIQAQRIDPNDIRTNLNLSYTYYIMGNFDQALQVVANGLAGDVQGQYRERLLEKQQQILAGISAKWLAKQEHLSNRLLRLS